MFKVLRCHGSQFKKQHTKGTDYNHQTITAEGIAKVKKSRIPRNSSIEMTPRVFSHLGENFMYNPSKITFNQYDRLIDNAPPRFLSPALYTMNQQSGMWKQRVMQEKMTMGITKLCAWKYLTSG